MKKRILSLTACLLSLLMLLPIVSVMAADAEIPMLNLVTPQEIFYEDHETVNDKGSTVAKTLKELTAGNSIETFNKCAPLDNLYDQTIVGSGYTDFVTYQTQSKALALQGNHESETCSKTVFSISNNSSENIGKGFITIVPSSVTKGLDNFTVNYIERQYQPTGYFGLALFYNSVDVGDTKFFNGYDNYTFTGFTGNKFREYETHSIYDGEKLVFASETMESGHRPGKNQSIYVSVACTKGEYTYEGRSYTAKLESYVDDILISTSYAQWVDGAPIMLYVQSGETRYDVQFTNIQVTTNVKAPTPIDEALPVIQPLDIVGTAVRYEGGAGLRFYMELDKEEAYSVATSVETGVILQESSIYQGDFTVDTEGVLRSEAPRLVSETDALMKNSYAFLDAEKLEGKTFYARGYVKYTLEGKDYYYYTEVIKASCARTAAKVVATIGEVRSTKAMLDACREMTGPLATLNIMSFNALVSATTNTEDYGVLTIQQRSQAAINMYLNLKPDLVGLQEINDTIVELYEGNTELMETYALFGSPYYTNAEQGTHGSGNYILYNKEKFELISNGVKWLSDTPDVPHSVFEEVLNSQQYNCNYQIRKIVYGVFQHKESGEIFAFASTHFEYPGANEEYEYIGEQIRIKDAELIKSLIESDAMFDSDMPFMIVGDYNSKPNSSPYRIMKDFADDIRYETNHDEASSNGTSHGYDGSVACASLDHIFVSQNDYCITSYKIMRETFLSVNAEGVETFILPSDHYAVMGTLTILPD